MAESDLGEPWKEAAHRTGWTLGSVVNLALGAFLIVGSVAADGGTYGPYLIGVTIGVMFVLLAISVQMTKGVRSDRGAYRRIMRTEDAAGIEIRLRRGPGVCGELMLVCWVVLLSQVAGLAFRSSLIVIGVLLAMLAAFFVVVVVDHALALRLRRSLILTPDQLRAELSGEVVSVPWSDIRIDMVEESSTHQWITITTRFIDISAEVGSTRWSSRRRHQIRLLPRRWRRDAVRVGSWLFDHPDRVFGTLTVLRRQHDDAGRRTTLASDTTLAHLAGDPAVPQLPLGR